jgi:AraC family transcriptional regulator of adaptative response / DNA-3-methyladenine glycosylase II
VAVRVPVARDVGHTDAAAVMGRLAAAYGQRFVGAGDRRLTTLFPTAAALMRASLTGLGMARLAAGRTRGFAHAVGRRIIRFDRTTATGELISSLTREAALDVSSAHWVAMRALGEPDTTPFGAPSVPAAAVSPWLDSPVQDAWRPWRSFAAVLLALPLVPILGSENAEIKQLGGVVANEGSPPHVYHEGHEGSSPTPADMEHLAGLQDR